MGGSPKVICAQFRILYFCNNTLLHLALFVHLLSNVQFNIFAVRHKCSMLGPFTFPCGSCLGNSWTKKTFFRRKIQFVIFISSRKSLSVSAENKALRFPKNK